MRVYKLGATVDSEPPILPNFYGFHNLGLKPQPHNYIAILYIAIVLGIALQSITTIYRCTAADVQLVYCWCTTSV